MVAVHDEHEDRLAHVERSDAVGAHNETSINWRDLRTRQLAKGYRSAFGDVGAFSPGLTSVLVVLGSLGVEIAASRFGCLNENAKGP